MNYILQQGREVFTSTPGIILAEKILEPYRLNEKNMFFPDQHRSDAIPYGSVIHSLILGQCFAHSHYNDISAFNDESIFVEAIGRAISPETFRQKLDFLGAQENICDRIDSLNVNILKNVDLPRINHNGKSYIVLDIDVTPMPNEKVHKEGISRTYKLVDGYAPINAYLGSYALHFELREGSQHSEDGAPEFLEKCFKLIKRIGIPLSEILVRVDSAHDASDFINACLGAGVKFIVKVNPRSEHYHDVIKHVVKNKTPEKLKNGHNVYYYVGKIPPRAKVDGRKIYQVFEVDESDNEDMSLLKFCANDDEDLPVSEQVWMNYEVDSYYTNLDLDQVMEIKFDEIAVAKACIELYHDHATSEQYHSELKTDMNVRLLPSKYFATNALVFATSVIAFNILRLIGSMSVEIDPSFQHHKKIRTERIRLSTVIKKLFTASCKIISHAREKILKFSRGYKYFETFSIIYSKL